MSLVVAFDLETTGVDPARDQILQIGAVAYDVCHDRVIGEFETLVNLGRIWGSPFALQMNQALLLRIAKGEGLTVRQALTSLGEFLEGARTEAGARRRDTYLCGFNVGRFDRAFIGFTAMKAAVDDPLENASHRTIELGSLLSDDGIPVSSKEAAAHLLAKADGFDHTALADCRDSLELWKLARSGKRVKI